VVLVSGACGSIGLGVENGILISRRYDTEFVSLFAVFLGFENSDIVLFG
jgi:hypothetical protein